ncbi:MAG: 30S ribosomal protein S6 [Gemmatimonadota bacterium]
MRDYEIVYIFDSALEQSVIDQKLERFNSLVAGNGGGEITAVEHWGKRQLAYPINKRDSGYYVVVQLRTTADKLPEFERAIKLDEEVLRYLVVLSEGELPTPNSSVLGETKNDVGRRDKDEVGGRDKDKVGGRDKDEVAGRDKDEVAGRDKDEVDE